jgi:hypothetical protein
VKLPVIKSALEFIEQNDEDFILETIEVIEHLAMGKGFSEKEIDTLAELLSNLHGTIEVHKKIKEGANKKDALNDFMKRVLGSIGK